MPTPSNNPPPDLPPRSHSSSCPDEHRASTSWRPESHDGDAEMNMDVEETPPSPVGVPHEESAMAEDVAIESRSTTESPRPDSRSGIGTLGTHGTEQTSSEEVDDPSQSSKPMDTDGETPNRQVRIADLATSSTLNRRSATFDTVSPVSAEGVKLEDAAISGRAQEDCFVPTVGYNFSTIRITPTYSSSFLRPGSKFHGTQQSERQIYDVQVEIKYSDLRESFVCGYLKIQGLTEDNPTLTTYFEGEIIGPKYGFITKHDTWGATEKIDINHWNKFNAFRPYSKLARKGPVRIQDFANQQNLFMRWKEHFLVPDHRVRTINGASFEGFYYICFNQVKGLVSGIYFHSKSEKFQQLELKHVEDRGCFGAMEFR